jgi:hypothetical protein
VELSVLLVVALASAIVATIRGGARRRRRRALTTICLEAGVRFVPVDTVGATWLPFRLFAQGTEGRSENVLEDPRDDGTIRVFDYSWLPNSGDVLPWGTTAPGLGTPWRVRSAVTCGVVTLPFAFPCLEVAPREAWDDVVAPVMGEAIALELEAFNRRFRVECEDRRFAVAFLDQRMMEAMLGLPARTSLSLNLDTLLLTCPLLPAEEVLGLLEVARRLRARVPHVVPSLYPPRPMEAPQEARWLQGHWSPEPPGGSSSGGDPPLYPPTGPG